MDSATRRVLMLCYAYPPVAASGVIRTVGFAVRLRALGWEPHVLTVRHARDRNLRSGEPIPANIALTRTAELDLDGLAELAQGALSRGLRLLGRELPAGFIKDILCVPDSQIAWFSTATGVRLARTSDVVYVSCSPFSSAISGALIKKLTGKPLVLDFRDAWTLNPHARQRSVHRRLIERLEAFAIQSCDRLLLNTPGACRAYEARYPEFAGKMTVVPNGYDKLNVAAADERNTTCFQILHVGSFYGTRTPDLLLDALELIGNDEIEFVHVGPRHPSLAKTRGRVRLRVVEQVSHSRALDLMRRASLLYLKQGREPGLTTDIAVAAKTYEYLATGLPILADCPPGDNADIVRDYAQHSYVLTSATCESLAAAIRDAFHDWRRTVPTVSNLFIETFNRDALARQLVGIFEQAIDPHHAG